MKNLRRAVLRGLGCGYFLITITLLTLGGMHLQAQQMTSTAPPRETTPDSTINGATLSSLPEDPAQIAYPVAHIVVPAQGPDEVQIESRDQSYKAGVYVLDKDVLIRYKDRTVQADHVEYDSRTGGVVLTGHVVVIGRETQERIEASHGTYNLQTESGQFYDVTGSYGVKVTATEHRTVYTTDSPFLFTGKTVIKRGPESYDIYEGTVTSCQLPKPDWLMSAAHISLTNNVARMHNSVFHLFNFPLLFLPYVTHPSDPNARESGILIPTIGESTTKGIVLGEQVYLVLSRSADLTVGAQYYSSIGWEQSGTFRYKGPGLDFLKLHYSGVLDRRAQPNNQGGEEAVLATRHDLSEDTRAVANIDYPMLE